MRDISAREKEVRGCLIILLEAAGKMTKKAHSRSATLKEFDQSLKAWIKLLGKSRDDWC